MTTRHTPGPWAIDRDDRPSMEWNNHIVQASRPHLTVCFMAHTQEDGNAEGEANASLIAAAPTMYEYIASSASNGCAEAKRILKAMGEQQ
jgi:hypothetical protein